MSKVNTARGEVSIRVGKEEYVLRPTQERQVHLDDALERGIMGTLGAAAQNQVIKSLDVAKVVHYLADDAPPVEDVQRALMSGGLDVAAGVAFRALSICAAGSETPEGNAEGPSAPSTD